MTAPRKPRTPLQQAVGLLARREHSQRELRGKLAARGVVADAAEAALQTLADQGLQDERRFAESLLRRRRDAGYGPGWVEAELRTHRLADELIDEVLQAAADSWQAAARDLLARRFGAEDLDTPDGRRRAQALLLRRGFALALIRAALSADD